MTSKASGSVKKKCMVLRVKEKLELIKKVEFSVSVTWVCEEFGVKKQCLLAFEARTNLQTMSSESSDSE